MTAVTLRGVLTALWPIIRRYKLSFLNLLICVLVTSVIGMVYPYLFGMLVDEVFYHRNLGFFKFIVIGYGLIYLTEQGLHLVLNSVWTYMVTRFTFDIRKRLYERIVSLKASYFHTSSTGEMMTVINRDAEEAMNLIHWNIFYLSANALRLMTAIGFVLYANLYLGLLMILVVPVVTFTTLAFTQATKKRMDAQRKQYGKLMGWCVEMLSGLRDIRLMGAERYTSRQFVDSVVTYMRLKNKTSAIQFGTDRAVAFVTLVSDLTLYIVASLLIVNGHLTLGGFIAMIEYFSRANGLLRNMSGANGRLQQNKVSLARVIHLLNEETEPEMKDAPKLEVMRGDIVFDNVSFRYRPDTPVLSGVNLRIRGGDTVAIVGKSGGGKSTLVSLLLRMYEPDEGEIRIDGVPISACSLASVRQAVGAALQEPYLFEGTIRSNLLWGSGARSDEELWAACRKASIAEEIMRLPDGLDTLYGGSSGVTMSGGQQQRIALARTFLNQKRIIVFDEATSALDGEAEHAVKAGWRHIGEETTVVIIAHRLSTILEADKVAVLEDGQIVAFGPHEQLLRTSDAYRRLFEDQYSELEEAAV